MRDETECLIFDLAGQTIQGTPTMRSKVITASWLQPPWLR
jgi:hypothetical protein